MLNLETSQEPEACAVFQHLEDREVRTSWDKGAEKRSAGQHLETQKAWGAMIWESKYHAGILHTANSVMKMNVICPLLKR